MLKNKEQSFGDQWDNDKRSIIRVIRVLEGKEKEGMKEYLKNNAWKFQSLVKDINLYIQVNSKQDKPEVIHANILTSQLNV